MDRLSIGKEFHAFPLCGTIPEDRRPASNFERQRPFSAVVAGREGTVLRPGEGRTVVAKVATEPSFSAGDPIQLPTLGVEAGAGFSRNYDVTPDGTRLIRVIDAGQTQSGTPAAPQIQVVLNWFEELKARVPTRLRRS